MKLAKRIEIDRWVLAVTGVVFPLYSLFWIYNNFEWPSLLLLLAVELVLAMSVTMFAHRAWAHKSWTPNRYVNILGLLLFTISFVGASIGWVAVHREHHKHTDTDKDPHSPYYNSRMKIQFLSSLIKFKIEYAIDLIRSQEHLWFARNYWNINILLFLVLFLTSPALLSFWIACLGICVFRMHTVNSLAHKTPLSNQTGSSNSFWLILVHLHNGEALHRNHHADPKSYRFSKHWYQVDPPAAIIELLALFKLAKINY